MGVVPRYSGKRVWLVSGNTRGGSNSKIYVCRACLYNVILIRGVYTMFMLSDADLRAYFEGSGVTVYQLSVMTGKPIEDIKKIVGEVIQ